jgi:N-acyl-D-aspartate/D-glutamate deacylase
LKKIILLSFLNILFAVFLITCSPGGHYDVLIKNGTIYDGTLNPGYQSDIAITDGKIVEIKTTIKGKADKIIEAEGLYVTPGFFDVHNHCIFSKKESEYWNKYFNETFKPIDMQHIERLLRQGITTVVTGNCGIGENEFAKIAKEIKDRGVSLNVIYLVGHGTIRDEVMGSENRTPTEEEMNKMTSLLHKAMEEGAYGLSTGLYYLPGRYASLDEIKKLVEIVAEYGGIYATDFGDYGEGIVQRVKEAIQIAEETGVTLQFSHLHTMPTDGDMDRIKEVTRLIEEARGKGLRVYADQISLYQNKMKSSDVEEMLASMLAVDSQAEVDQNVKKMMMSFYQNATIHEFPEKPELEGKTVKETAAILNLPLSEVLSELIKMGAESFTAYTSSRDVFEHILQKPWVMTCTDGGNYLFAEGDNVPRDFGSVTRKIRKYVLDENIISMEFAIRSMTSLPAEMLGLTDRGQIKEGNIADIVIFNPNTIMDKANFENPYEMSEGVEYLLVNGVLTIEQGKYIEALSGSPIKSVQSEGLEK